MRLGGGLRFILEASGEDGIVLSLPGIEPVAQSLMRMKYPGFQRSSQFDENRGSYNHDSKHNFRHIQYMHFTGT
jgi:hypothetical protein